MQQVTPSRVYEIEQVPQGIQGAQGGQVPIVGGSDDPLELTNIGILERLCLV